MTSLLRNDDGIHCAARSGWSVVSSLNEEAGCFALLPLLPEHDALGQVWPEILWVALRHVAPLVNQMGIWRLLQYNAALLRVQGGCSADLHASFMLVRDEATEPVHMQCHQFNHVP